MGGKSSKKSFSLNGSYDYTLYVQTGDRPKVGTDANVYCILKGAGLKSKQKKLDVWFHDDFERGQMDKYLFKKQSVS